MVRVMVTIVKSAIEIKQNWTELNLEVEDLYCPISAVAWTWF